MHPTREFKATCCFLAGYDYSTISSMAIQWDCSFEEAMDKVFTTL